MNQTIIDQITEEVGGPDAILSSIETAMFENIDEGYCTACASFYGNVEPDARKYACHVCNKKEVYSLTEIFL
jgi:transposase-like protein